MGKVIDSCIEVSLVNFMSHTLITGVCINSSQGYVIVQWLEGKQENCWPQDIELIPDNGEYALSESDDYSDDDKVRFFNIDGIAYNYTQNNILTGVMGN